MNSISLVLLQMRIELEQQLARDPGAAAKQLLPLVKQALGTVDAQQAPALWMQVREAVAFGRHADSMLYACCQQPDRCIAVLAAQATPAVAQRAPQKPHPSTPTPPFPAQLHPQHTYPIPQLVPPSTQHTHAQALQLAGDQPEQLAQLQQALLHALAGRARGPPRGGMGQVAGAFLEAAWKLESPQAARALFAALQKVPPAGGDMYRCALKGRHASGAWCSLRAA